MSIIAPAYFCYGLCERSWAGVKPVKQRRQLSLFLVCFFLLVAFSCFGKKQERSKSLFVGKQMHGETQSPHISFIP